MEKQITSHLVKGLILSLILIVISLVANFTGQQQASWAQWAGNLILLAGVIVSCITYANQMDNYVTFGNVFAHGFKTSVVTACLVIVFTVAFLLLSPEVKEEALEKARQEMIKNGTPDEAIDKGIAITKKYFFVFTIAVIIFFYLLIGLVGSLLGAAISKKKEVDPFSNIHQTGEVQ